jgi:hypothetical protein
MQSYAPNVAIYAFLPYILIQFAGKRVFFLSVAFAMAILDLISRMYLALFVVMLPK